MKKRKKLKKIHKRKGASKLKLLKKEGQKLALKMRINAANNRWRKVGACV